MSSQHGGSVRFTAPPAMPGVELATVVYPERSFPCHFHPEFVIGAIVGGAETLQVGAKTWSAPAGTTLLLNPEQTHANASVPPDPLSYRMFYISRAAMAAWLPALPFFSRPVTDSPALFPLVVKAHAALERSSDPLAQQAAFAGLIEALAEAGAAGAEEPRSCLTAVRRVREYIETCYSSDFGLDELCGVSGLSRFHLIRSFKRATGLSPFAYRTQCRIAAARSLLRTDRTITSIAYELGFADHAHFTRLFQRLVGTTPSRYRGQ